MEYEIIDSVEKFRTLETHWQRLATAGGVPTPYQSFPWLDQWLRHRRAELEPMVVVLHQGKTIAPLGRSTRGALRELRMLGTPDSDYVGLVTTRPLDEAWDGVARVLGERRRCFDVVHLQSVRDRDQIVAALKRHLHDHGRERIYERCPWISTDRSWEELRKSLASSIRSELRRWDRRMRELGELRVEQVRAPLDDELVAELEDVERGSWKWEQGESALRPGSQREFLRALLRDSRADVAVWMMRVSGDLVAYALVLVGSDRWYYYLPSFRKKTPNAGASLLAQIVEAACGGCCTRLDLLRGDHAYKRVWSDRSDNVYEILWPSTLRGRLATFAYSTRWRAARSKRLRHLRDRLRRVGDRRS